MSVFSNVCLEMSNIFIKNDGDRSLCTYINIFHVLKLWVNNDTILVT